jgi:hypothetical protein
MTPGLFCAQHRDGAGNDAYKPDHDVKPDHGQEQRVGGRHINSQDDGFFQASSLVCLVTHTCTVHSPQSSESGMKRSRVIDASPHVKAWRGAYTLTGVMGAACGPLPFAIQIPTSGAYDLVLTLSAVACASVAIASFLVREPAQRST